MARGAGSSVFLFFFRVRHPLSAKGAPRFSIDFSALGATHKARSSFVNMKFDKWATEGSKRGRGREREEGAGAQLPSVLANQLSS